MDKYTKQLRSSLSTNERRVYSKLNSEKKIQDFLDTFPINFSRREESIRSPRQILKVKKIHCMEGAVLAATAIAYHGLPPLLLDLQAVENDDDHVVCLFSKRGCWGAISKTNYPVLRWRDPVYRSVRELAMSYFHEYFLWQKHGKKLSGKKTMRAYSKPFDLRRYRPETWVAGESLDWLAEALDASPHFPIAPPTIIKNLRPASAIETKTMEAKEWLNPRG